MKKRFNWLGWIIVILYVMMIFCLGILTIFFYNKDYIELVYFSFGITIVAIIIGLAILPGLYNLALGKLLPVQKSIATVVNKQITASHSYSQDGGTTTTYHHFITFYLSDGEILELFVKKKKYYIIFVGEQGLLSYKREGKHKYFIDFERH